MEYEYNMVAIVNILYLIVDLFSIYNIIIIILFSYYINIIKY